MAMRDFKANSCWPCLVGTTEVGKQVVGYGQGVAEKPISE